MTRTIRTRISFVCAAACIVVAGSTVNTWAEEAKSDAPNRASAKVESTAETETYRAKQFVPPAAPTLPGETTAPDRKPMFLSDQFARRTHRDRIEALRTANMAPRTSTAKTGAMATPTSRARTNRSSRRSELEEVATGGFYEPEDVTPSDVVNESARANTGIYEPGPAEAYLPGDDERVDDGSALLPAPFSTKDGRTVRMRSERELAEESLKSRRNLESLPNSGHKRAAPLKSFRGHERDARRSSPRSSVANRTSRSPSNRPANRVASTPAPHFSGSSSGTIIHRSSPIDLGLVQPAPRVIRHSAPTYVRPVPVRPAPRTIYRSGGTTYSSGGGVTYSGGTHNAGTHNSGTTWSSGGSTWSSGGSTCFT